MRLKKYPGIVSGHDIARHYIEVSGARPRVFSSKTSKWTMIPALPLQWVHGVLSEATSAPGLVLGLHAFENR